jgi:integrase
MALKNRVPKSACHTDVATDAEDSGSAKVVGADVRPGIPRSSTLGARALLREYDSPSSSEGRVSRMPANDRTGVRAGPQRTMDGEASRTNSETRRRTSTGLQLRKRIWHIDKVIHGKRICESTKTGDLREAEVLLAQRICGARRAHLHREPREYTFREAAAKFLAENGHKKSIERDERSIEALDPFIGSLPLKRVHQGTLEPYFCFRRAKGNSGGTINREIALVRRILNLASKYWRDDWDLPWISKAPMIQKERQLYPREPYSLSILEEQLLFSELPDHLKKMALFKVNTGLREGELVNLRWEWEIGIPELYTSIFVIPREFTKNARHRYVVMNSTARCVIEQCRFGHPKFVFTFDGKPVTKIYNSGWKAARRRAALRYEDTFKRPCPFGFKSIRVHDLKHTFGHRLRGAGVSFEDRKFLLGHKTQDMTTHYSAAEIGYLIAISERVCELVARASPSVAVVRSGEGEVFTPDSEPLPVAEVVASEGTGTDRPLLAHSVYVAAAERAEADGISLDQFILAAVAEKVGALRTAGIGRSEERLWRRQLSAPPKSEIIERARIRPAED